VILCYFNSMKMSDENGIRFFPKKEQMRNQMCIVLVLYFGFVFRKFHSIHKFFFDFYLTRN
jgi:hypothetical protein